MDDLHVVAHVAVSLDGATTGFQPDVARFYELAAGWQEDVTLAGSDTILAQEAAVEAAPRAGPAPGGPLLAVVDGRGRVRQWDALREVGHWSDVVALYAADSRPAVRPAREIVAGTGRVDLGTALEELAAVVGSGAPDRRSGAEALVVRVDSGGALTGALLAAGLLDEVSLLVHPCLAGPGGDRRWHGAAPVAELELTSAETLDGGLVWLRYRVER